MYKHRDEDNFLGEIGPVFGSNPKVLPPKREDPNFQATSLQTADIEGCKSSTKGLGNFHSRERRGFLQANKTDDIIGACPGSL